MKVAYWRYITIALTITLGCLVFGVSGCGDDDESGASDWAGDSDSDGDMDMDSDSDSDGDADGDS